jgi:hypothetical protein
MARYFLRMRSERNSSSLLSMSYRGSPERKRENC